VTLWVSRMRQPEARRPFATLTATVPAAVIELAFDPIVRLADLAVRLETLALAGAIATALLLAAWLARSAPADPVGSGASAATLGLEDLLFTVLGILPGAFLGGRLGYVLIHLDYYVGHPASIIDPSQGSLELGLAVAGGALSGSYVASLLGGSIGQRLHLATVPLLVGLGLGKLAMALGGDGQGSATEDSWATAYLGDGPWGSLAAAIPAHPAQVYEALATLLVLGLVVLVMAVRPDVPRDGRLLLFALVLWSVGRTLVAMTWRDPPVVGPLRAGQLIAIGLAAAYAALLIATLIRGRQGSLAQRTTEPEWPDPAERRL
jgi:phosphatidylglycerol:prolipoprotein diacylglycerol transferase